MVVTRLPRVGAAFAGAIAAACLVACTTPTLPPYSRTDLRATCERLGGCWHPDALVGGDCEDAGKP